MGEMQCKIEPCMQGGGGGGIEYISGENGLNELNFDQQTDNIGRLTEVDKD